MADPIDLFKQRVKTPIRYSNPFGDYCELTIPEDCDVVILAVNKGFGLEPVGLFLPHQIYVRKLQDLLVIHNAKEIVAIPASSKNYIEIIGEYDARAT